MRQRMTAVAAATVLGLGGMIATAPAASATGTDRGWSGTVRADINPLNNSGVSGVGYAKVSGNKLRVSFYARGLLRNMPHAAHIHYGEQARHECPTTRDDTNRDFRLTTAEGLPAYGPIAVSLTTRGDTSPASALAVDRFSSAPNGKIAYKRSNIKTDRAIADAIRHGEGVLVIHGLDYNNNGKYDFEAAGKSELDPKLPAEATDPAACGVLHKHHH